jgi:hypothetical protein
MDEQTRAAIEYLMRNRGMTYQEAIALLYSTNFGNIK